VITPRRIDEPELLDEHDAPGADVERSLRDLRRINRYLGGVAAYKRLLRKLLGAAPAGGRRTSRRDGGVPRLDGAPLVLDIGAGSTDLVDAIANIRPIALDFKIDHLLYGRNDSKALRVAGDARALPFRTGSVDAVTSAHFFHHFSPDENAGILEESLRVARVGVAVNDTRRHYAPLLVVRLIVALRLVGRITRSDAPGSILRGYTLGEARQIAERVPAARRKVVRLWPYRFGILLWKR
jgi:hypothetical protein